MKYINSCKTIFNMQNQHEYKCTICNEQDYIDNDSIEGFESEMNECKSCHNYMCDDHGINCDTCNMRFCLECNHSESYSDYNVCDNCIRKCFHCGGHVNGDRLFVHELCSRVLHVECADYYDGPCCECIKIDSCKI